MKPSHNILSFGINGSLRKRELQGADPHTEHYLFNSAANLKAYSNNLTDFAYYGYNASNTRAYKLGLSGSSQWVNGQQQSLHLAPQQAMFYPNAYINFNQNGEYTKHYYNGAERIASRLGDNQQTIEAEANDRLQSRIAQIDELFKAQISEMAPYEEPAVNVPGRSSGEGTRNLLFPTVGYDPIPAFSDLQPTGNPDDIFYYHTNHLGSTAFVTDGNATITQGFLYAPFGEITTEFNASFGNGIIPKYTFNAKELDEETGMYYYEARYYNPPVFVSRDAMFEKYFWLSPYAYCANNPMKYVDPTGCDVRLTGYDRKTAYKEFKKGAARYDVQIRMNRHGDISGRYVGKSTMSAEAKMVMDAIGDHSVKVLVNTTYGSITENNAPFIGGAFLGTTLNNDGTAEAHQDVNPGDLKRISNHYGKPGQDMLHEVTEAYQGAKIAQKLGRSVCNSQGDKDVFEWAHSMAIPQSGEIKGPFWVKENELNMEFGGEVIGVAWDVVKPNGGTMKFKRIMFDQ